MDAIEEREVLMDNPILVIPEINWDEIETPRLSKTISPRRSKGSANNIKFLS